jgi:predicted small lipoprotein YifL
VKAAAAAAGGSRAWFLCSADGLELGRAVAAVAGDEELQPEQLYFVLPAVMRRRALQAEEMAALAIRASAALAGDHDGPLEFPDSAAAAAAGGRASAKGSRRRSRRAPSLGRDFVPDLVAIAE